MVIVLFACRTTLTAQMSEQVNGGHPNDGAVLAAAHQLASSHLSPALSSTPPSSGTHSPASDQHIKPPATGGLHTVHHLSPLAENATINLADDPMSTAASAAPTPGSHDIESSQFFGNRSVSDQAFPFPNSE